MVITLMYLGSFDVDVAIEMRREHQAEIKTFEMVLGFCEYLDDPDILNIAPVRECANINFSAEI